MRSLIENKKGALELSVGTIVVIVIAMSMLILGLVLVRTIFTGATYNVDTLNDKVKSAISGLFEEDGRSVVYLAGRKADVTQGSDWGIAFAFKNLETGTDQASPFRWEIQAAQIPSGCSGLTPSRAES